MTAKELVDMVGRRGQVNPAAYQIMVVLARGWLIERARSARLRARVRVQNAELEAFRLSLFPRRRGGGG